MSGAPFDPVEAVARAKRELEATPHWALCAELQARLSVAPEQRENNVIDLRKRLPRGKRKKGQ